VLAVSGVRTAGGETRLAATGLAGFGTRLRSAEAAASDPARAGDAAVSDATFGDDALASAWYRERTLPVLVRRVLAELEEAA
jgi:CO/xanthine dehydrogenase FAD-binding subunit